MNNSVDKIKSSCYSLTDAAPQFLLKLSPLYSFFFCLRLSVEILALLNDSLDLFRVSILFLFYQVLRVTAFHFQDLSICPQHNYQLWL